VGRALVRSARGLRGGFGSVGSCSADRGPRPHREVRGRRPRETFRPRPAEGEERRAEGRFGERAIHDFRGPASRRGVLGRGREARGGDDNEAADLRKVEIFSEGAFRKDEGEKVEGLQRLRLTVAVHEGVSKATLRYYFEELAAVDFGAPRAL
jgi:hypothetical protein